MTVPDRSAVSRRSLLAAGAGLALATAAPTARAQEATPAASPVASPAASPEASPVAGTSGLQADGSWTFTDDRGVTVVLPAMPQRIIADVNVAGALWDFGIRPLGVFGWNITGEGEFGEAGGNVDPAAVEFLNDPQTTLNVERAANADPDLILSLVFGEQYGVWSILQEEQPQVEAIAPIVTISGITRADLSLERFAELAQALGADLTSAEVEADRADYEAATARLQAAAEATRPSAIFVWASPAEIYIASPDNAGDVTLFRELGLDVPVEPVAEGEYWEILSTEQALKYPTDILFHSSRSELASLEDFRNHPTFSAHPAVVAGQVYAWNQDFVLNYAGIAASLIAVADAVEAADPAVAP